MKFLSPRLSGGWRPSPLFLDQKATDTPMRSHGMTVHLMERGWKSRDLALASRMWFGMPKAPFHWLTLAANDETLKEFVLTKECQRCYVLLRHLHSALLVKHRSLVLGLATSAEIACRGAGQQQQQQQQQSI